MNKLGVVKVILADGTEYTHEQIVYSDKVNTWVTLESPTGGKPVQKRVSWFEVRVVPDSKKVETGA